MNNHEEAPNVTAWLKAQQIKDIIDASDSLIAVKTTDKVMLVIQLLRDRKLLSVPVFDEEKGIFLGFIDVMQILSKALQIIDGTKFKGEKKGTFLEVLEAEESFAKTTCGDILRIYPDQHFIKTFETETIYGAISKLIVHAQYVKRLPIVSKDSKLIGVLSQSRIVEKIADGISQFKFSKKTIEEIGLLLPHTLISVLDTEPLRNAFEKIARTRVSAVAVLNSAGKIVGTVSSSDLKRLGYDFEVIGRMHAPVSQFVEVAPKNEIIPGIPICIQANTTIEELFAKFSITKVHRLWVVDEKEKPIGVVSLIDVIYFLYLFFPNHKKTKILY